MPITKEVELEDGSRVVYLKYKNYSSGRTHRRIYLTNRNGAVQQVAYSDNQKRHAIVLNNVPKY